jgi:indolepyruvate ferredoxin oxidoreductase, alpha subunit
MSVIDRDEPGRELLLMGNEAIARGALEAGVRVAAAYPGTPSTDILETLARVAGSRGLYVEWSVNEKVALEVAAAGSYSGLRSLCAMKQNGLNVASDFLLNVNLIGVRAGTVLVVCDDPSAHSSNNEQDSRPFARMADLPLLEPATFQEAKDMVRFAFDLSEELGAVCLVRSVTRISHARGNVVLGNLPPVDNRKARFDTGRPWRSQPIAEKHLRLHRHLDRLREAFSSSPFNFYRGPEHPDLLLVTGGTGWLYSLEALEILGLESSAGILKIGTSWPLPEKLLVRHLARTERVLFLEEVEPFLEAGVKEIAADHPDEIGPKKFFGKKSGHVPVFGEMDTDRVLAAVGKILGLSRRARDAEYQAEAEKSARALLPDRTLGFCPGCPHRASYWAIKNALRLDNRDGFATYDIGCYALARGPTGFHLLKTGGAMGTGIGLAGGFAKFSELGFAQPVIAMCGDSTFFHAALPGLVNACHNRANVLLVVLDNGATAMTGFQPHPGIARGAGAEAAEAVSLEAVCRAVGAKTETADPFDFETTREKVLKALEDPSGVKVLILRRPCRMLKDKEEANPFRVWIDPDRCLGEACGCNRLCTRVFRCPGLIWDARAGKARVDEVVCAGCGVCAEICPAGAIRREATGN